MKITLVFLSLFLAGCAGQQRSNGLNIMADSMDCEANGGRPEECQRIMQRGIAQVARDTAEPGPGADTVLLISF